eukprot:m.13365 g.13365  ORF g.13365 m.13365 type:complete len:287 (+) comp9695_c0_seq1:167-1027(+)
MPERLECKPPAAARAIKPHTLADFENFLRLASVDDNLNNDGPDDFQLKHNKHDIRVWSKIVKNDPLKIIKLRTTLPFGIETVFDVLCDDGYRLEWDEACIQSEALYKLSDCSTVDYYSMKSPSPLSKRDVTSVRTWQCSPNTICVITSSIVSKKLPVKKGIVRANGKLSGYVLERTPNNKCVFTYVNQFDPCGSIPKMLINYFTTRYMPKYIGVLANACKRYPHWKDLSSDPTLKPWLHPHQNVLPQWKENTESGSGSESTDSNNFTSQQAPHRKDSKRYRIEYAV